LTKEKEIELKVREGKVGNSFRASMVRCQGSRVVAIACNRQNSQWYKNILQNSHGEDSSGGQIITGKVHAITGKREVAEVIQFSKRIRPRMLSSTIESDVGLASCSINLGTRFMPRIVVEHRPKTNTSNMNTNGKTPRTGIV